MTDDRIREPLPVWWARDLHGETRVVRESDVLAAIRTALAEQREEDARVCDKLALEWRGVYDFNEGACNACAAAIRGNASAESEDARDAARWRHVRERAYYMGNCWGLGYALTDSEDRAAIDAWIDAARGKHVAE